MKKSETRKVIEAHIENVRNKLSTLRDEIQERALHHDESKLKSPEAELWERMDLEPRYAYGTKEYFDKVKRNKLLFDVHYENNRHHPEHYPNGVEGMNLIDLLEFVCDITSYRQILKVQDIIELMDIQSKRFGIDEQLRQILVNTVVEYFSTLTERTPEKDFDMAQAEHMDSIRKSIEDSEEFQSTKKVDLYL